MQIHFLLTERLEGYVFNPHRPEGLNFSDATNGIQIEIRAGGKEDSHNYGFSNLELRAKVSHEATESQVLFVEALLNDRTILPNQTPMELPHVVNKEEVVTSEGKVAKGYFPTIEFLPDGLRELCLSAGEELERQCKRFMQLLRWVEKADGPVSIRDDRDPRIGLYWKTIQEHYHGVPWPMQGGPFTLEVGCFGGLTWSEDDESTFGELWSVEGEEEPLGHQLLREAKSVIESNSRSALLICYSALEVGLKQHISKCAPDAGWLAMYSPTPPLFKMLRDYMPEIHKGNSDIQKWSDIRAELKLIVQFTEDRNRLAHRGESIAVSTYDYLRLTEDLLYTFDVLEGHEWAKTRVSRGFGKLLGWPLSEGGHLLTIQKSE